MADMVFAHSGGLWRRLYERIVRIRQARVRRCLRIERDVLLEVAPGGYLCQMIRSDERARSRDRA